MTLELHLPRWLHTEADAEFSEDRTYRYWLTRRWGPGPALMFVSLNPSDADEHRDDQTTRRDMDFARDFGYDAVTLLNLGAAVMERTLIPPGRERSPPGCGGFAGAPVGRLPALDGPLRDSPDIPRGWRNVRRCRR